MMNTNVMKKLAVSVLAIMMVLITGFLSETTTVHATEDIFRNNLFRVYNPNSGEHFYTDDPYEAKNLESLGWRLEGVGWVQEESDTKVYRLYNPNAGEHHYTMNQAEKDMLVSAGWKDEGVGWSSAASKAVPVYREYNPNVFANNHNYTTNKAEHDYLVSLGWRDEGIGWYAAEAGTPAVPGQAEKQLKINSYDVPTGTLSNVNATLRSGIVTIHCTYTDTSSYAADYTFYFNARGMYFFEQDGILACQGRVDEHSGDGHVASFTILKSELED